MATNSDGSIVLSVKVDDSNIQPQLSKLKSKIENMAKSIDKIAASFANVNTQLSNAEIQNEKVKQAQEQTAQAAEKTKQAIEKTTQSQEKTAQAVEKTKQAQEQTTQAAEKTNQAQEKTKQSQEKTSQAQQKSTQEAEKTKQAIEKTTQAQEKTKQAIIATEKAQRSLESTTNKISATISQIATSLGIYLGARELLRFSGEASKLAGETEAYLKRINTIYGESGNAVYNFIEKNATALGMAKTTAYEAATSYGNLFATFTDSANNAKLTNQMLQATAVIASQTGRTYDDVFEKIRSGLYGNIRAIDDLGISVRKATIENSESFQQISRGVINYNDLTDAQLQQIRALEILRQTQALYGDEVINSTALARSQFTAAFEDFKAAWGNVINVVLVPILNVLATIFNFATKVFNIIAALAGKKTQNFSGAGISNVGITSGEDSGSSGKKSKKGKGSKSGKSNGKSQEEKDIEAQIKALQKKNKELQKERKEKQKSNKENKKELASFDTLEILQSNKNDETSKALDDEIDKNNEIIDQLREQLELAREKRQEQAKGASGGAGGGGGGVGVSGAGDSGNFEGLNLSGSDGDLNFTPAQQGIAGLVEILVGSGLIALGLAVATNGHLVLGLTLIMAGVMSLGVGMITLGEALTNTGAGAILGLIAEITGTIAIVIGLAMCCAGAIPLGAGLIAFGLGLLGAQEYALGDKEDGSGVIALITSVEGIVGGALLGIGAFLIFMGSPGWGIAAIVAGLTLAGYSAYQESKDDGSSLETWLNNLVQVAGAAMLSLGIIILKFGGFNGASAGLGIALVVAGAAVLALKYINENDNIPQNVKNWINVIFAIVSVATLVIGIIMLCSGIVTPLSIGLVVSGAVGLASTVALNWDAIKTSITQFLEKNKALIVGIAIALVVIGIILCCTGAALPLGIGLIVAGGAALGTEIALNWDTIKEKIKVFVDNLIDYLKIAAKLVIGAMLCASGVGIPLGLALILAGAGDLQEKAATVDWESIGKTIQEKWDDIKEWIKGWGLLVLGAILCSSGVGLPLGISLMKKGGANLTEAQDPMWTAIKDKVKEVWESIKQFWNNNIAKYFTADWWKELGEKAIKGLANAMIKGLNSLINSINKLGFDLPDVMGGGHVGFNIPKIPPLAKGAILPANKPFLAVLGDQKQGTNIEAPAELIKQMAKQAIIESQANLQNSQQTIREEHYYLDQTELMSILYKLVKGGERISGTSLVNN